ncbi:hypothetical protein D9613_011753 [Agrocybe pediades]|uniref:Uncharacterized protein n=1 Tax=Agrocybe pediades TaxID=84607 RepID=A0A8H4VK16_9AGAR|nr:hypothetical protein D9613_011753 [Agrocybe pediades]
MNFQRLRSKLVNDKNIVYLGNKSAVNDVVWKEIGNTHTLVQRNPNETPHGTSQDDNVQNEENVPLEPALLSIIVHLSGPNSFLAPDANWTKPTTWCKTIDRAALTLAGTEPKNDQAIAEDVRTAIETLKHFENMVHGKKSAEPKSVIKIDRSTGQPYLKFRHALLKTIEEKTENDTELESEVGYDISNWPTSHAETREALDALTQSHFIRPLPAYTRDNRLLRPDEYKTELPNAIVEVQFTFHHWGYTNDTYAANIISIDILKSSPQIITTPKRRRHSPIEEEESPLAKKSRKDNNEEPAPSKKTRKETSKAT